MSQDNALSPHADAPLLAMRDIAALAGVQRPVISNWRRRHADFPTPVAGSDARPLFGARQVCDWLVTSGRVEEQDIELDLHLHTLTTIATSLPPRTLVGGLTALICLSHLDTDPLTDGEWVDLDELWERACCADPSDDLLCSELAAAWHELGPLALTVDNLIDAAWGHLGAFDRVLAARDRFAVPELCSSAISGELGRLIAGLSRADERGREGRPLLVADPAAGAGDLLVALTESLGEQCSCRIVGTEADGYLARLARRRLVVGGVDEHDLDLRVGADWEPESGDPDVVVTQVPYRPQEQRSAGEVLSMVDEISLRLRPGTSAVVLGPAEVLTGPMHPYSTDERARAGLLSSGTVEAVVRLPGGLMPFRPGYETAIWVLTSAQTSRLRGRVLLGDVSNRSLTPEIVEALIQDVVTWRGEDYRPEAHTRRFCVQTDISTLIEPPRALTARVTPTVREVRTEVPNTVARMTELEARLDQLIKNTAVRRASVRTGSAAAGTASPPPTATIDALVKARRLLLLKGARVDDEDLSSEGHHTVLGAEELTGTVAADVRWLDREVLAERYPHVVLTEPGDVVVTVTPKPAARVDESGYSLVEFPARALRIPPEECEQFTPRVLAALLTTGSQGDRSNGAVRPASRIGAWELPLLDHAVVARLDAALERIEVRRRIAEEEITTLDELHQKAMTGLADGTLTLHSEAGH